MELLLETKLLRIEYRLISIPATKFAQQYIRTIDFAGIFRFHRPFQHSFPFATEVIYVLK